MTNRWTFVLIAVALFGAACQEDMEDVSQVTKFRILAVQADPPEVAPGDGATLKLLFADPAGEGRDVEIVWLTCVGEFSPTSDISTGCEPIWLPQIASAAEGGDEYPIPFTPMGILDLLPEGEEDVTVTAVVIACAGGDLPGPEDISLAGEIEGMKDLCKGGDGLVAVKSFIISGSDSPNTNPEIREMYIEGESLAEGETAFHRCTGDVECREDVEIDVFLTDDSYENYEQVKFGKTETVEERTYVSWFVTGGSFNRDRSGTDKQPGPYDVIWMPPRGGGKFDLWVVAHDVRGGVSWQAYSIEAE